MQDTEVIIPKVLQEFHGEQTTIIDLVATYLAACIACLAVLWVMPAKLSIWQEILLLLLSADIGGGVVANLTKGTTQYHANHATLRLFFIAPLHLIHPAILALIFPGESIVVFINAGLIIISAYWVNYLKEYHLQKVVASLLLLLAIAINLISQIEITAISFLMILFAIKLILSYAVRWEP